MSNAEEGIAKTQLKSGATVAGQQSVDRRFHRPVRRFRVALTEIDIGQTKVGAMIEVLRMYQAGLEVLPKLDVIG